MITTGRNIPAVAYEEGHIENALEDLRHAGGRPSIYSPQLAAKVLERMNAGETVTRITEDKDMPSWSTICDWVRRLPEFAQGYAQAKIDRAPRWAEGALDVLENAPTESMAHVRKAEAIANHRLSLAKFDDRDTYGDKVQQDVSIKGVVITTSCRELQELLNGK